MSTCRIAEKKRKHYQQFIKVEDRNLIQEKKRAHFSFCSIFASFEIDSTAK